MKAILALAILCSVGISHTAAQTPFKEPPAWSKNAIWYQIFVERFNNGDTKNDPTPENIRIPSLMEPPADWTTTPWTKDWYSLQPWEVNMKQKFNETISYRRYGGDLQGIINKLDYLQQLGVNAIFINPINDAPSLHKYDARNYHHIDVNIGPDPVGDNAIIAKEDPSDPVTWKWTSADKLFLKLVAELHKRNMRIIMDYSWNHTGTNFWAWKDVVKNQQKSVYKDFYAIDAFDNPETLENEFKYTGWAGVPSLPELKKVNVTTERVSGKPYEGTINAKATSHIYDVTRRWMKPNGDVKAGVDGFRLDVADQIGMGFWRSYRELVRSINPDAYLIGEIWWEQWPNKLMDPTPYTQGDIFDAVMFYQVYKPARYFFAKNNTGIDAATFKDQINAEWNRLRKNNLYAMMNVSSSHDAPRLLTDFYNPNKYKFGANPNEDPNYKTGKPDDETYQRLRLYLLFQYTSIGAPQIWNGEEMGMWGADDPHPRKPLWWKELTFEQETRNNFQPGKSEYDEVGFNTTQFNWYQKLIALRKANSELVDGTFDFNYAAGKLVAYTRTENQKSLFIILNADDKAAQYNLPKTGNYVDLLTGKKYVGESVQIPAISGMVLKKL